MTKHTIGKGWYHNEDDYDPDHDREYSRYDLPLNAFAKLRCNMGVYKVVLDALSSFLAEDKHVFWGNYDIKVHHGSPFHIIRSRVSMIDDPKSEWRIIVDLDPDEGVVYVKIISPVRDYMAINKAVRALLKKEYRH
jgi:hypothetical protein